MGLTSPYTSSQVNVVGGGVEFANDNYWSTCDNFSWFHQFLSTTPAGERPHLPTLNMSLRRSVFEAVGGIDETYPLAAGEDTEWTERMRRRGYRLYFEPKAVVVHLARRTSLVKMLLHSYNYGRFSPKIGRPSTSSQKPGGRRHPYLQAWWVFLLAAPFLATIGTGRVLRSKPAPDVWPAIPGIWLSKLAWCLGAVHTLRERKNYGVPIL
jgi:hypothetical protein